MARKNNQLVVPQAQQVLDQLKFEVAQELGINLTNGYNGHLTAREAGAIGGHMVKKMIQIAEQTALEQTK